MYGNPRTFRCPNCREMINDQMSTCRYCAVPIDPGIATLIAERQEKANQAYSDASFLRTAAVGMFVFLVAGLFLTIAYVGFVVTFVVTVTLLIQWQAKFGELLTDDPDFARAKRSKNIAALLVVAAIPAGTIFSPFIDVLVKAFEDLVGAL